MYEREMTAAQAKQRAMMAQTQAGYIGGGLEDAAPTRPSGVLKSQASHLGELLSQIEVQRNRLYSLIERVMDPRPTPGNPSKEPERISTGTLEGHLQSLASQAAGILGSLSEIADRLDSAV